MVSVYDAHYLTTGLYLSKTELYGIMLQSFDLKKKVQTNM
jgi:hypothetical protein